MEKMWLPAVQTQLKYSTFDSYRRTIRLHVLPRIGEVRIDEITPRILTRMYLELLARGRLNGNAPGLSPATVRYIHTIMHKAFADAVDEGLLRLNPAERAKAPRRPRSVRADFRLWDRNELATFLQHIQGSELEALWHVAALTGMRRGELLGLQWNDIDFDHRRVSVRRNLVCVAYRLVMTTPKSHQARVIDLDERTTGVLADLHAREHTKLAPGADVLRDDQRVFCGPDGEPLHPERVSAKFQAMVRAAGVPRIRFHDLRHTHATLALQAGVPAKVISERLGHHTPEFTMQQYAHVLPGMQAEAAALVAELVAKSAAPARANSNPDTAEPSVRRYLS
jgi:integrase